jgi:hypothetical protein
MNCVKQDNWTDISPAYGQLEISWQPLAPAQGKYIFHAKVGSEDAWVRMNDFPDEPLYTLIVGSREIIHFSEWPSKWRK